MKIGIKDVKQTHTPTAPPPPKKKKEEEKPPKNTNTNQTKNRHNNHWVHHSSLTLQLSVQEAVCCSGEPLSGLMYLDLWQHHPSNGIGREGRKVLTFNVRSRSYQSATQVIQSQVTQTTYHQPQMISQRSSNHLRISNHPFASHESHVIQSQVMNHESSRLIHSSKILLIERMREKTNNLFSAWI